MYVVLFFLSMYFLVGGENRKRMGARASTSTLLITIGNVLLFVTITVVSTAGTYTPEPD